jgi:hypothetical protein
MTDLELGAFHEGLIFILARFQYALVCQYKPMVSRIQGCAGTFGGCYFASFNCAELYLPGVWSDFCFFPYCIAIVPGMRAPYSHSGIKLPIESLYVIECRGKSLLYAIAELYARNALRQHCFLLLHVKHLMCLHSLNNPPVASIILSGLRSLLLNFSLPRIF